MINKPNPKGRCNQKTKIIAIREDIYTSQAWQSLRPTTKVMYLELRHRYKKNPKTGSSNNGKISLSVRESKQVCKAAANTVRESRDELVSAGFVKIAALGLFRNRHATTFILTDEAYASQPATNEWRNYKP